MPQLLNNRKKRSGNVITCDCEPEIGIKKLAVATADDKLINPLKHKFFPEFHKHGMHVFI